MSTNSTIRTRRRGLLVYAAVGLGAIALLGACTGEDGEPLVDRGAVEDAIGDGTLPDVDVGDGGDEAGGGDADDAGGGDAGGGDAGDAGGDEAGGGDAGAGDETQPPTEETVDDEGLTTEEWVLLGIIGFAILAIIVGATSAATRHSEKKQAARAALNNRLGTIVGSSRWIVDQGSAEILRTTDPNQLQTSWNGTRPRMIDVEADIGALGRNTGDSNLDQSLSYLGQTIAGLRGSLDSFVAARTSSDAAGQQALIDDAVRTVQERRQQVNSAIGPVQAGQR